MVKVLRGGLIIIIIIMVAFSILILFYGCKEYTQINILAENEYILLPFYAEKAYGKLNIKNTIINLSYVENTADFIRLLNLSKYNVIIIDNVTYNFIRKVDNSWIKVCTVGEKKPAVYKLIKNKQFSDGYFYALNTPLYRNFAGRNTIFLDSFSDLIKKNNIYFKTPLPGFQVIRKIGRISYLLCIRKNSEAAEKENLKNILLLWEDGVTYMYDPLAIKYILYKNRMKERTDITFGNCM
ncbi:hypothetical protein [Desulfurobacterium sp.]